MTVPHGRQAVLGGFSGRGEYLSLAGQHPGPQQRRRTLRGKDAGFGGQTLGRVELAAVHEQLAPVETESALVLPIDGTDTLVGVTV